MVDLNIKNGKIFLKDRVVKASLSIDKGKIVDICKERIRGVYYSTNRKVA